MNRGHTVALNHNLGQRVLYLLGGAAAQRAQCRLVVRESCSASM
ncbi:hypothetical protein [Jiella pelagia]|uniref:Uncharacterized protein n=1 Tax=Jiella pelagia TaxID=2986949 RepID=A0ABY7BZU8_9HYPH|nr:hypothetical protein [Jiella pelagia]WAP69382.1 hypothetical protein OH818_03605 [Jiella pelagia]